MSDVTMIDIKEQHKNSYKLIIKDLIKNNTNTLIDEDIMSLFRKPPLDSMDIIRCKFLENAKNNNVILNSEILDKKLDSYRRKVTKECNNIKKIRLDFLIDLVDNYEIKSEKDIIKINKKDFNIINKTIKKDFKDMIVTSFDKSILKGFNQVFLDGTDNDIKERIVNDISKFVKNIYFKQVLENINIKIIVKDNILINGIKEQGERFVFTINNSRLLNDGKKINVD